VHGHTLYDEQILVPLILHDPTREYDVKRVTAQVRSIDVLPSIIDVLGIPAVEGRHGRSLAPLMKGGPQEHRYAWSHVQASEEFGYDERFSLRTGTHKLVMTPRKRGNYFFELYDLESDPGERETIHTRDPARRARLQKLAHGLREAVRTEGAPEFHVKAQAREPGRGALQPLEPRVQERLRELGYVE